MLSIYRNYRPNDITFQRIEYFVHYKFLPGLGFYGFGLTHMIGGLSQAATQALRQLIDAGTLKNLPAGFKSRGMRVRDDDQPIQPGAVSYTHLRAHETEADLVCRLLLERYLFIEHFPSDFLGDYPLRLEHHTTWSCLLYTSPSPRDRG